MHVYVQHAQYVTIFSTGSIFRPVLNFTKLHALTQATRSCALLLAPILYHTPPYSTILCHIPPYSIILHHTLSYTTILHYTPPYSAMHYHTPLYSTIPHHTPPYTQPLPHEVEAGGKYPFNQRLLTLSSPQEGPTSRRGCVK